MSEIYTGIVLIVLGIPICYVMWTHTKEIVSLKKEVGYLANEIRNLKRKS